MQKAKYKDSLDKLLRLELAVEHAPEDELDQLADSDTKFDKNDPNIFKAPAFVEKVDEIWNLVRDEAIKAQGVRAP